ncbi:hypothetical protein [Dactylosporangium sp. NPDC051484]|uniref:hypothetical protein n=1 Tax=Dactylosporangium sp. NPDC051484 TaxID=3154942 RepID=UPI00344CDFED
MPRPAGPAADSTPSENRRTRSPQTVLALIALAGTLATPILGYLLGTANTESDTKQQTIADQQATIDNLRAENGLLRAQVANPVGRVDWIPSSPGPSPSSPGPSPSSPGPSPEVWKRHRSGTLTLPFLYCADLDSDAQDWLVTNTDCGNGRDVLLGQDFQGLRAGEGVELAVVQRERASFAGCRAEKALSTAVPYSQLGPKTLVCARTTENNVALLEVVTIDGVPEQRGKVTFNVTLWGP